jgi:hypothetical protein
LPAAAAALIALLLVALVWIAPAWEPAADRAGISGQVHPTPQNSHEIRRDGAQPANSDTGQTPVPIRLTAQEPRAESPYAAIERLAEKANSKQDDWQTEVVSEAASAQLAKLAMWLEQPRLPNLDLLASVATGEVECQPLRPADLREVYRDGILTVRRPDTENLTPDTRSEIRRGEHLTPNRGVEGFHQALSGLYTALGPPGAERHIKFKVYRIELTSRDLPAAQQEPATFNTLVRYEASRHGPDGNRQQTAVWNCEWTISKGSGFRVQGSGDAGKMVPLLTHIRLARYEEAESTLSTLNSQPSTLFADCTESALANNASYRQQVLPGINHWLTRVPREFLSKFGYNGLAVGDVNGDGLDDLYVCDSGGLPNRLYVQQSDGTARDVSAEAGVDFLDDSTGALLIDLDNDGDQDLVVAIDPVVQIAENDGTGRFQLHAPLEVNTDALSLCAADYDIDGDLDVYVCGYNVRRQDGTERGLAFPMPYHDANNGGRNVLLRNEGDFRFVDVTREVGLDVNNTRFSMAAAWEDFDNDGDQDLYVANDFGRNNLYRNDRGEFTDIAGEAGVEDIGSGMSVSWDDYNRDGLMDLYVGNMWSSAGNRVTYQPKFSAGKADGTVNQIRRMAKGNTLFKNGSAGGRATFSDVSEEEAVDMGRWAWASKFIDLTNDGWPDLLVANGFITNPLPDDL